MINNSDAIFSDKEFSKFIEPVFKKLIAADNVSMLEKLRPFLDDEFYNNYVKIIEKNKKSFTLLEITRILVYRSKSILTRDSIEVEIKTNILFASKKEPSTITFVLTCRKENMVANKDSVHCYSCGSSFSISESCVCKYCGSEYDYKNNGWIITSMRGHMEIKMSKKVAIRKNITIAILILTIGGMYWCYIAQESALGGMLLFTFVVELFVLLHYKFIEKSQQNFEKNREKRERRSQSFTKDDELQFDPTVLGKYLENTYKRIEYGRAAFDYEVLKENVTSEVFKHYSKQLDTYKKQNQKYFLENLEVIHFVISTVYKRQNDVYADAYIGTKFLGYLKDLNTGLVVSGDAVNTSVKYQELTFKKVYEQSNIYCDNCGATVKNEKTAACPYCNSEINSNHFHWVLDKRSLQ